MNDMAHKDFGIFCDSQTQRFAHLQLLLFSIIQVIPLHILFCHCLFSILIFNSVSNSCSYSRSLFNMSIQMPCLVTTAGTLIKIHEDSGYLKELRKSSLRFQHCPYYHDLQPNSEVRRAGGTVKIWKSSMAYYAILHLSSTQTEVHSKNSSNSTI